MQRGKRGFTVIELLVTLIVLGIVVSLGVPSLRNMVLDMRLSAATNDLLTFFNYARSEAARRGARVTMCISSDQATCATAGTDWGAGAVAFLDSDGNGQVNGAEVIVRVLDPRGDGVTITATTAFSTNYYFYYRPSGASNSLGTLRVCRSGRNARDVAINAVGRPASQVTTTVCA